MGEPLDRTNRVFVQLTTFDKALPALEDVIIEYSEGSTVGRVRDGSYRSRTSVRNSGGQLRCSNPACRRGGYELDFDIHDMVRNKLVSKRFVKHCPGDEGSPKGRRPGRTCLNSMDGRITLIYKPELVPERIKIKDRLTRIAFEKCTGCSDYVPLVPLQEAGRFGCGEHIFELLPDGKLKVLKAGSHWWPKQGEILDAVKTGGTVELECLLLSGEDIDSFIAGSASPETKELVERCLEGEIPVLAKADGAYERLSSVGGAARLERLKPETIRRICV
jgi:hypothetical protein